MKLTKSGLTAIILLFILAIIGGCATRDLSHAQAPPVPEEAKGAVLEIRDSFGRTVQVNQIPQRIVSLAPSVTETLFALGLGDRVVGVTDQCDYPQEAKVKEKTGGFAKPSVEKILALEPDLVIGSGMHHEIAIELGKIGVPAAFFEPKTVADTLNCILLTGRITGSLDRAERLVDEMTGEIELVRSKVSGIPDSDKPKVYYEVWYEPLMTAGPGTVIDDLIKLAGGVNVAADAVKAYPEYSVEALVSRNPDVMIHSYGHGSSQAPDPEAIRQRPGWQTVAFVRTNQIQQIDANLLTRPGPRITEALLKMAKAIHPELFK